MNLFKITEPSTIYNGTAWSYGESLQALTTGIYATSVSASTSTPPTGAVTAGAQYDSNATNNDCTAAKQQVGLGAGLGTGIPLSAIILGLCLLLFRQNRQQKYPRDPGFAHSAPFGSHTAPEYTVPLKQLSQKRRQSSPNEYPAGELRDDSSDFHPELPTSRNSQAELPADLRY